MMGVRAGPNFLDPTTERAMDHRPSVELLESTHLFPGVYKIKAIGAADDDFESRVVEAVCEHLAARSDLDYAVRTTPGGRHVALTLDITVQTAEQVRAIYAQIREVKGLTVLF
jgi:putative lipoic acid-binding regulatory protein